MYQYYTNTDLDKSELIATHCDLEDIMAWCAEETKRIGPDLSYGNPSYSDARYTTKKTERAQPVAKVTYYFSSSRQRFVIDDACKSLVDRVDAYMNSYFKAKAIVADVRNSDFDEGTLLRVPNHFVPAFDDVEFFIDAEEGDKGAPAVKECDDCCYVSVVVDEDTFFFPRDECTQAESCYYKDRKGGRLLSNRSLSIDLSNVSRETFALNCAEAAKYNLILSRMHEQSTSFSNELSLFYNIADANGVAVCLVSESVYLNRLIGFADQGVKCDQSKYISDSSGVVIHYYQTDIQSVAMKFSWGSVIDYIKGATFMEFFSRYGPTSDFDQYGSLKLMLKCYNSVESELADIGVT